MSYARPDRERVLSFFEWLSSRGINVWMDCRSIKAGQNWEYEIHRALNRSTFVLAFISKHSFDRRGYIQKELKLALNKKDEKLIDDIYIIPILLDNEVEIPVQIKDLHYIKASDPNCLEQIRDSITHQLDRLGIERHEIQQQEQVYWTYDIRKEEWDGIPGYEVELQFISFRSDTFQNVSDIGEYIKADLLTALFQHRANKISPIHGVFNYGQDRFVRTNTYDARCSEPIIQGKVISIQYAIHWYGAGAAHPNHHFRTYVFLLDPVMRIESLKNIFEAPDDALKQVQKLVREALSKIRLNDSEADEWKLDAEWITEGTLKWDDFGAFVFQKDGINILFPPYQVGPYAYGSHSVTIPYEPIVPQIQEIYQSALGIEYIKARLDVSR